MSCLRPSLGWTYYVVLLFGLYNNKPQAERTNQAKQSPDRETRQATRGQNSCGSMRLGYCAGGDVLAKRGRMLLLPVKGCSVRSSALLSLPVYTRMESFPLQLTLVSADRHPSRLTLTALLDTAAKLTTGPRANLTSLMQPPKPAAQHRRG